MHRIRSFYSHMRLRKQYWFIFLTCWLVYLFHIGPWPGVNENRYINLTRSIVEESRLSIDRYHYNTVDKSYYEGHYYVGAPPGPAILAIPPYLILKAVTYFRPVSLFRQYDTAYYIRDQMGAENAPDAFISSYPLPEFILAHIFLTAFIPCILSALTSVLLFHMLGWFGVESRYRLAVVGAYAFGTIVFFYSVRFYAHAESTFFLFLTFFLLFGIRHNHISSGWTVLAGFSLGISATMEYTIAPVMIMLGIYTLAGGSRSQWIPFGLSISVPMVLLAMYQWICFGNPLTTPFSLPMSPGDPGPHIDQMEAGINGFGIPTFTALWGLTLSPYRGLFLYSPVLILACYALGRSLLSRTDPFRLEWGIIAGALLTQLLFNSAMLRFWSGGYVFGPRYLIPMLPLLMIALGRSFRWVPPPLILFLGAVSVLINWAGVQYIVSQNAFNSIGMFLLSGPTTQFYEFLNNYLKTYTDWGVIVSPLGGYLLLGVLLTTIWKWWGRHPHLT